jgi:hypothetical protein
MNFQSNVISAFRSAGSQTKATFGKLANGGFSTFVKILILVVTFYIICISATNIAAYAYILRRPGNDSDVSDTWCVALIVLNVIMLLSSLAIHIITIVSFFRKGGDKVAAVVDQAKMEGADEAIKMAAQVVADNSAKMAEQNAIQNGESTEVAKITRDVTYKKELIKNIQDFQNKIMGGQPGMQGMDMGGMAPEIDPAQAYYTLQRLGLQLQVPQDYMM